jgi:hypothetical protein
LATEARSWSALPRWRRARPGWLFLHVLFGLGVLGLAHVVAAGLLILEVRPPGSNRTFEGRLASWGALGAGILLTFLGWLLFVYLRRSRTARWTALLSLAVLGFAVNLGGQFATERYLIEAAL